MGIPGALRDGSGLSIRTSNRALRWEGDRHPGGLVPEPCDKRKAESRNAKGSAGLGAQNK